MQLDKELSLKDLYFTALEMLFGVEGEDWGFYEQDEVWWELRLYTRRN